MYTRADRRISLQPRTGDQPDALPCGARSFIESPYTLTLLFFVTCVVRILVHAMWRDELQAWSIATASSSLADLFQNFRYEGHPAGWFLILYALSRVTNQPVAMQLFHAVAASGMIYVVARYAPFTWIQKILFTLGYFPFFEYAVVSRCYVLGILLFFIACALYCRRREDRLTLAVVLFLMCQTSAYGIMLALAVAMMYAFDWALDRWRGQPAPLRAAVTLAAIVIFVLGIPLAAYCMRPPPDSGIATIGMPSNGPSRLERVIADVWYGYIPLRIPNAPKWTNLGGHLVSVEVAVAIPLFIVAVLIVAQSPAALFMLLCGTFGQLVFKYWLHPGATRHHGHLYILFVGAYWIRETMRDTESIDVNQRGILQWFDRHRKALVIALFAVNAVAGLAAAGLDLVKPFSASREVARYIRAHYPADAIVVGDDNDLHENDELISPLAGNLGRPVYYASRGRFGTFVIWDKARRRFVTPEDLFGQIAALRAGDHRDMVLVVTHAFDGPVRGLELVRHFDRSVRHEETYYLYHVTGDPVFTGPRTLPPKPASESNDPLDQ